jgi:hypothetical protein
MFRLFRVAFVLVSAVLTGQFSASEAVETFGMCAETQRDIFNHAARRMVCRMFDPAINALRTPDIGIRRSLCGLLCGISNALCAWSLPSAMREVRRTYYMMRNDDRAIRF